MTLNYSIIISALLSGIILSLPKFRGMKIWRATVTPLASIIGSGFLVLAPVLVASYGLYAPLVMAGLCLVAYLFGGAIRYNIQARHKAEQADDPVIHRLEIAASWALVFAFMISVGYYLNLFGAFGVSLTPFHSAQNGKMLTSAVYLVILIAGWTRGFAALEKMEYSAVTLKLGVIAGLLVGLAYYFYQKTAGGTLYFSAPKLSGWPALTLAFGLLITVQGFETSRYLGQEYDAAVRVKSMKLAQLICTVIYMVYIGLFAYSFEGDQFRLTETAIIDMMGQITPILPVLLVGAALAAQFSAAIADTSGSGGLIEELTRGNISAREAYALLAFVGLVLTWGADLFEIIVYASRAFALYYSLQSAIAARYAFMVSGKKHHMAGFAILAILGMVIVIFGNDVKA